MCFRVYSPRAFFCAMDRILPTLLLLLLACCFANAPATAQVTAADPPVGDTTRYWTTGGSTGLNFSQVKLSNWAGGGESSISVGSLVKLEANYAKGQSLWENRLNVAYGLIRQGDDSEDNFRKTDDIFQLISQYNQRIRSDSNFYVTALADFRTQMSKGYEYFEENGEVRRQKISNILAPGFLVTSLGITYKVPDRFGITLSPIAGKFTFVQDSELSAAGAFGVTPGETLRSEFGASLASNYQRELFNNVTFSTNLMLFGNYGDFSHIDVNWESALVLKVNRYINSTVATQLIYDHDVLQKTQFRNVINVGFLYQWPEKK